jgi:hypothetical protein
MTPRLLNILVLLVMLAGMACAQDVVTYVGGPGHEQFTCVLPLSDGSVLVGGWADSLQWVPRTVTQVTLAAKGIHNAQGGGRVGFIAQFEPGLTAMRCVASFPLGAVEDVRWIRTSAAPGAPTGDLFISATTKDTRRNGGGYVLAKLDGNFVRKAPAGLAWVRNVYATGDQQRQQPWDVGGDGKVVFAEGEPYDFNWNCVYRLAANGSDDTVPHWRIHWTPEGRESFGVLHGSQEPYTRSGVMLKPLNRPELRSWFGRDYARTSPDGNGGVKTGTWPMDVYFAGPAGIANPTATFKGPGQGGWSVHSRLTQRAGAIAVDRATNSIYLGFSSITYSPWGQRYSEPCVIAYTPAGDLKWWSRLHAENERGSCPNMQIDGLAVAGGDLVVLGRTQAGTVNFWRGNTVNRAQQPDNPGYGFLDSLAGAPPRQDAGWLGKLRMTDGALRCATYIAEFADDAEIGGYSPSPNLDGWPLPSAVSAPLAATVVQPGVVVDGVGRVYVSAGGQRVVTTAAAFQKMPKPTQGRSGTAAFARIYAPMLDMPAYSTLLSGKWDPVTGEGGGNTVLTGVCPVEGGVVIVGYHRADAAGAAVGNPVPTLNVPAWGQAAPSAGQGILARLTVK